MDGWKEEQSKEEAEGREGGGRKGEGGGRQREVREVQ